LGTATGTTTIDKIALAAIAINQIYNHGAFMSTIVTPYKALILGSIFLSSAVFSNDFVAANHGANAVAEAAVTPYVETQGEYVSAEDKLADFAESRHWNIGWDDKKQRIFVIHSESFDNENPAYDKDFITKRSMYTAMASLSAKAKIVEFMREQMTAVDQLESPGTDVHAELNEQFLQVKAKLVAQQKAVAKLAKEMAMSEGSVLEGATWNDRSKELMVAVIKKLDESFDSGAITEEKRQKFELVKSRFNQAQADLVAIQSKANSIAGSLKGKSSSVVETLAKAPLLGATMIAQSESWNEEEEQYEVAVLMVWSGKLEKSATALLAGEMLAVKPKAGVTIRSWVKKQDLSTLTGSRQVIDEQGQRWFVGAYAMPYSGASSAKRKSKKIAELMAKKEAVMALFSDVETHKQATIAMETRGGELGGKDNTQVATSLAETTRQAIENRQVSGLSQIAGKSVIHPISGTAIYVAAYAISPQSAIQGLAMESANYQGVIKADMANLKQLSIKAGYENARQQANEDFSAQPVENHVQNKAKEKLPQTKKSVKAVEKTVINASDMDDDDF
jgi:hypothetical protein